MDKPKDTKLEQDPATRAYDLIGADSVDISPEVVEAAAQDPRLMACVEFLFAHRRAEQSAGDKSISQVIADELEGVQDEIRQQLRSGI